MLLVSILSSIRKIKFNFIFNFNFNNKKTNHFKMGFMDVPKVKPPNHIICLVLNWVLPGIGTIAAVFMSGNIDTLQIIIGVAQFCLSWVGIGWLWAIVWGVLIFLAVDK
jgi:hypothetical protein